MNAAQRIISKFGGQSALADAVGTKQSTVQYWAKQGAIPAKWHSHIVSAAVDRGLSISPGEFSPVTVEAARDISAPQAHWPGLLAVADQDLPVYVLEDGRRVITRTGALNFLTGGKGGGNLESYLRIKVLEDFLPQDLYEQFFDVSIPQVVNKSVQAMSASAFIDICSAYYIIMIGFYYVRI